jgi:MFS family permease
MFAAVVVATAVGLIAGTIAEVAPCRYMAHPIDWRFPIFLIITAIAVLVGLCKAALIQKKRLWPAEKSDVNMAT